MNIQEKTNRMAELKAKAEASVIPYNTLLFEEKLSEAEAVLAETEKTVDLYNGIAKTFAYDVIIAKAVSAEEARRAALKPEEIADSDMTGLFVMRFACESPTYEVITVKTTKTEMVIDDDRERRIDLEELQTYYKKPIGNNPHWKYFCVKFNQLMGVRAAIRYGLDPKKVFEEWKIKDIVNKIELGETPTSDTQLLKTAKAVIDAMIGEIKVIASDGKEIKRTVRSCDVSVLADLYSTDDSRDIRAIKCPKDKKFINILFKICASIVTGQPYTLTYNTKSK